MTRHSPQQAFNFRERQVVSALHAANTAPSIQVQMTDPLSSNPAVRIEQLIAACDQMLTQEEVPEAELETRYERGCQAYERGDYAGALPDFAFLLQHAPLERRFHMAYASALQQEGQHAAALTCFFSAACLLPEDPGALFRIAECLLALGQTEEARESLHLCLELAQGDEEFLTLSEQALGLLDTLH